MCDTAHSAFSLPIVPSISIGQAVLQKVVAKLGGVDTAAVQLGIEPSLMSRFLDGTMPVPDNVLLRAVDIVLDELHGLIAGSQPFSRTNGRT